MKTPRSAIVLASIGLFLAAAPCGAAPAKAPRAHSPSPTGSQLLEKASAEDPEDRRFAEKEGAETFVSKDGKTFYVCWKPENYSSETPWVVSLHGHGSWTFRDFRMWLPYVRERGYAILTVQWWKGTGERSEDYLTPPEIYKEIDVAMDDLGVSAPALLEGFSRGSAVLYAVAAMDVHSGRRRFDLFVANAGKAAADYPPNRDLEEGRLGPAPFEGTRWITVGGGRDKESSKFPGMAPGGTSVDGSNGLEEMRATARWVESRGGKVILSVEDPGAGHDVFHRHPENVKRVLDAFDDIAAGKTAAA